jgi:hypothetical protein
MSASIVQYSRASKASISRSRSTIRRQVESDQVVERPARLLGVDQVHGQFTRIGHRFLDRLLGDLGELHPEERNLGGQPLLAKNFIDVPGNGLALAIQVCRQVDGLGLARGPNDFPNMLFAAFVQFVGHRKIVVRVDRTITGGQIANMTIGSQHLEVVSKIPVDGGRFGRGLDDEQFDEKILGFLLFFINGGSPARCQTSGLPSRRSWPPGPAG